MTSHPCIWHLHITNTRGKMVCDQGFSGPITALAASKRIEQAHPRYPQIMMVPHAEDLDCGSPICSGFSQRYR
jgi:hypothetical protein